ncbi:hypothetical protein SU69_07320 [Thermosipho melanesiensis]|nr:hypothetical protein SU68_07390 [Thermosipho melanesiensis]OOC37336.1 hypothetical protein SU69_07320 [Thermosipho melanesiensis]OOC38088.1 hypothetical protein SU70_07330 [Thermosipho melanesiensis]OOC41317.1 hypothetical protein SU71_07310 [Thermosipho melanesiensis]OOC43312.1 hypothetical protein SU72_07315 [Thermosipho melanesiensis]
MKQAPDGKFYLEEDTVVELANYIKQLQDLNENYKKQIENLKAQISNLEKQILNLEQQVAILNDEKKKLEAMLKAEQIKTWTVVAVVALGATVLLFIK